MQDDYEEKYHRVESEHWWFVARRHLVCALVQRYASAPSSRILDLGCSGGVTIQQLVRAGYTDVGGLDVSPAAIERCRSVGLTNLHAMDAQAPDLPNDSYDLIIASDVLEHLADEQAALQAWCRILRPNGVLLVFVPAFMFMWSPHDIVNQHYRRYRLPELQASLAAAGFETLRRSYWNFLIFPPAALVRLLQRVLPPIRGMIHLELRLPPAPLNRALVGLLRLENWLIRQGVTWPWGQSALVIARKPAKAPAKLPTRKPAPTP